ncbi:hypothetical protein NA57DRAFT_36448, partial [Rhizodiscina lignyota]
MAHSFFRLLIAFTAIISLSRQQQHDPLNDFCRRFGQQTAVVDNKLFIQGGLVDWNPLAQYTHNDTNTWFLYNDLNHTTDDGMPILYSNLSINSSVPAVSGGILWQDTVNKYLYQFGGQSQTAPGRFSLWRYDIILNQWNQTLSSSAQDSDIQRVNNGAGVAIDEIGVGYYLGGYQSNTSDPGWVGPPKMTSTLIRYDMDAGDFTNNTGPDMVGRAEGVMVFIPASDRGLLIYFGGVMDPYGNGTSVGSNMSTIYIYDIASAKWYTQTAAGDIPENRRLFCAGATWPDDQTSYNIYLYGGEDIEPNSAGFDDVWILSLPSFTWIKWWPTQPGPGNPHHSMTCNVINRSQMLIIGGTFPLTDTCDSPTVWGTHNLNLGENGPNKAMWDVFMPNITEYVVPQAIIAKIGGGPGGGATVIRPQTWDNRDLSVYFSRQAKFAARSPTRAIPTAGSNKGGSSNHTGAIVGGTVGGVVGVCIIIAFLVWFLRCRR